MHFHNWESYEGGTMLKIALAIILLAVLVAVNLVFDYRTYEGEYYPTMVLVYLFIVFVLLIIGVHSYKLLRNKTKKP